MSAEAPRLYRPGASVSIELTADAGGEVPAINSGIELFEDGADNPKGRTATADGAAIGRLIEHPDELNNERRSAFDAPEFQEGDTVGTATVELGNSPVNWLDPVDGYEASVGERVVWAAGGGVRAYEEGGETPDSADMPMGVVFTTGTRQFFRGNKVAVYQYR